jgi:hypothetical protein
MSKRDTLAYVLVGLSAWVNGAIGFRLGGRILFQNGPFVVVCVAIVIAVLVCAVFQGTFSWRKGARSDAVTVAVIMALPGLFGETARQGVFTVATGLPASNAPAFAAVIFFGNAVLLTYAVVMSRRGSGLSEMPGERGRGEDGPGVRFAGPGGEVP